MNNCLLFNILTFRKLFIRAILASLPETFRIFPDASGMRLLGLLVNGDVAACGAACGAACTAAYVACAYLRDPESNMKCDFHFWQAFWKPSGTLLELE